MRNRIGFISLICGLISAIIVCSLLFAVMHINVVLQYHAELLVINKINAKLNNRQKFGRNPHGDYLCFENDLYKKQLDAYDQNTKEFYSYKFYFKIGDTYILPSLLQTLAATLNLLIVNIIYLLAFFIFGSLAEIFVCNNMFVMGFYLLVVMIIISCCVFWSMFIIAHILLSNCVPYCNNQSDTVTTDQNNSNNNEDENEQNNEQSNCKPNDSLPNKQDDEGTSRLLDV